MIRSGELDGELPMVARRASALLLVALVASLGCKKKPAADTEAPPQDKLERNPESNKVVAALDQMAREIEQDKAPTFGALATSEAVPPDRRGIVTVGATEGRAKIDAAFGRFWTAWESRPDRIRRQMIRQKAEQLTKQGVPADKAKAQAEQNFPPLKPLRVTGPNPEFGPAFFGWVEADVAGGVKGIWSPNGDLNVRGSVEFSELLRLQCNGSLSAGLRGRVERLDLHANGNLVADLAELQAPTVEARPNGNLFLRLGPGTKVLKLDGNAITATVVVRGNPGPKIEGAENRNAVVLVNY